MQKQTINALIVVPNRDDFSKVQDLLLRINKWRYEVQWEPDFDSAIRQSNECNYDIILLDDDFGQRVVSDFLAELRKKACIIPVILLISKHENPDAYEIAVANTGGYSEKAALNVYELERWIRYAVELKSAVERHRESERRLRSIFFGAAIGIALFSLEGQILEANPALSKITGFSREELCSFYLKDLFGRPTDTRITELYSDLIGSCRDFFQIEERFKHKNGKDAWVRLTGSHFMNDKIEPKFAVGLFENITEPKQTEEAVRRAGEQMRILSRKILDAQENDRKLIAHEIHDSICGSLAAIKFALEEKLESMGKHPSSEVISLEKIIAYVDETIKESRRISAYLRPSLLDDLGLLATVSWFCREFEDVHLNIKIEKQLEVEEDEIPERSKVVIYRVLQEAMNNVAKHSDATRVRLHMVKQDNRIGLTVADNGCGFDPKKKFAESKTVSGFGLLDMRDRTILSDGQFEISSEKGKGTTVHISLPCDIESIVE